MKRQGSAMLTPPIVESHVKTSAKWVIGYAVIVISTNARKFTIALNVGCFTYDIWHFLKWKIIRTSSRRMYNSIICPLWGCCAQVKAATHWEHVFYHVTVSYLLWRGLSVLRWRSCSRRSKVKRETMLEQGLNLRTDKDGFFLLSTFIWAGFVHWRSPIAL